MERSGGSTLAAYAFPTLGALQVNEITRRHVVDALSPHLDRQAGASSARCWPSSTTSDRSPAATSLHLFWMCSPQTASRTGCCCPQAQPDHIARMTLLHHLTGRDPLLSAPFC